MRKLVFLALAISACVAPLTPPEDPSVVTPLPAAKADFMARQHVTGTFRDHAVAFDAVVQKSAGELVIIGLTPFGSRAFVLRQAGTAVTFEKLVPIELPFPPKYILLDVHRSVLDGFSSTNLPDGVHEQAADGETLRDEWRGGRIVKRTITRSSGDLAGAVTITYDGGIGADGVPPKHVRLDNGWFGYQLEIDTSSWDAL